MGVGRLHHVILDCPDPRALAAFYGELLSLPVTYDSDDFVVVATNDTTSGVAFQRASDYQAPRWPDPEHPQQVHLDVMVDDLDDAESAVLALGASKLHNPGSDHVYCDLAGHPFCLVRRPAWAPPINETP